MNVNQKSHPDLYWALRGGGNNFGVVTRFDLITHEQGLLWSEFATYGLHQREALLKAFLKYGQQATDNPDATLFFVVGYHDGNYFIATHMEYAKPVEKPAVFSDFHRIPSVSGYSGIRTLSNITLNLKEMNPSGLRQSWWTATYKLDEKLVDYIVDTFVQEIEPVKDTMGIVPVIVLQIITPTTISQMQKNGGNALGLTPSDGPLLLFLVPFMWLDPTRDDAIRKVIDTIIAKATSKAKADRLYHEYKYMNYASQYQDVIPSYGKENHRQLLEISKKYDPHGVFQKLQPGYFKLGDDVNRGS